MRYYWRARVYDTYDNGWSSTLETTRALDAQTMDLKFPDLRDNLPDVTLFTIYLNRPILTLLGPNHPVWLSRPSRAELAYNPDGTADLASLRATPSLRAGEIYSVRSSLNSLSVAKLRQAGSDYPEWVTARYLQLPESISLRTRQLAAQLAKDNDTPYDVAQAITFYLRANYKYSETVPLLPNKQDLVDWFLFDLKQGFCNYYASAEVILLRSVGIPARLAVGYAQGDNIDDPEFYTVRQRDAHAWPEVYFPGIGWVEFEPTVSQPELVRPQQLTPANAAGVPLGAEPPANPEPDPGLHRDQGIDQPDNSGVWQSRLVLILAAGLVIILTALLIPLLRRKQLHRKVPLIPIFLEKAMLRAGLKPPRALRNMAFLASLSPLERAYQQINSALARLGRKPAPRYTPAERAASLIEKLPAARDPTQVVIAEYHLATYSPRDNANQTVAQRAGNEIRRLSFRAKLRKMFGI
jgi:transglutaminase-like putative cysteine protease